MPLRITATDVPGSERELIEVADHDTPAGRKAYIGRLRDDAGTQSQAASQAPWTEVDYTAMALLRALRAEVEQDHITRDLDTIAVLSNALVSLRGLIDPSRYQPS